jgi:outer membrane protein TolC
MTKHWLTGLVLWGLLASGWAEPPPLTLAFCLDAAMQHNRELLQAREQIALVKGDRLQLRSRFLPHLELAARLAAEDSTRFDWHPTQDQSSAQLRFSQRLFEFGPDALQDIRLREELRQAMYTYQGQVYTQLSRVWEVFQLILLQEEQLASRRQSREGFQTALTQQQARYERRLATEEEKLSAELNVLAEDLAINSLERRQGDHQLELLRLIGHPLAAGIRLEPTPRLLSQNPDEAVGLALANDVEIALLDQLVEEQRRAAAEVFWEYSPDLSFEAGLGEGRSQTQLSLDREDRTWGMNLASQYRLHQQQSPGAPPQPRRWFAGFEARLPLFEGGATLGRRAREKARLRQLEIRLQDTRGALELQVRQAHQALGEALQQQELQAQRVTLTGRRLAIHQILKDKGQADESLLEQVRAQFFAAQDTLLNAQENAIHRQALLRRLMGYLE